MSINNNDEMQFVVLNYSLTMLLTDNVSLHFHPGYNAMQLTGGKLMKLDEIRRQLFDQAEEPPDWIFCGDIIHAIENDLFFDAIIIQQFFNVDYRHVACHNIEAMEAWRVVRLIAGFKAERIVCSVNRYENVIFINNVASNNTMHDIGGNDIPLTGKKERRAGNVFSSGIYLLIADQKSFFIQRPHFVPRLSRK